MTQYTRRKDLNPPKNDDKTPDLNSPLLDTENPFLNYASRKDLNPPKNDDKTPDSNTPLLDTDNPFLKYANRTGLNPPSNDDEIPFSLTRASSTAKILLEVKDVVQKVIDNDEIWNINVNNKSVTLAIQTDQPEQFFITETPKRRPSLGGVNVRATLTTTVSAQGLDAASDTDLISKGWFPSFNRTLIQDSKSSYLSKVFMVTKIGLPMPGEVTLENVASEIVEILDLHDYMLNVPEFYSYSVKKVPPFPRRK